MVFLMLIISQFGKLSDRYAFRFREAVRALPYLVTFRT